ncbi:MAG: sugar ABC transporter ATP-binding protein [Alphaproteobacteria bacterium]|nr:sugar ABC transporter ATP-binding protein [Alphaproteobacteria bacterium]
MSVLVRLGAVTKSYGAVEALRGVDLEIRAGDVLALCGDNGAGKSSLVKILSGAHAHDGGVFEIEGKAVRFASPQDALTRGIATIYQELAVAPRLSVAENVFLGSELVRTPLPFVSLLDKKRMRDEALGYLKRLGVDLGNATRPVERLSGGQRQAVAIARALRWNARVVIMDEPTAALGVAETKLVLDLIRRLKDEGRTVVLVSHNMADVVAVATRVAILKAGRKTVDRPVAGLDAAALAQMIVTGREAA